MLDDITVPGHIQFPLWAYSIKSFPFSETSTLSIPLSHLLLLLSVTTFQIDLTSEVKYVVI